MEGELCMAYVMGDETPTKCRLKDPVAKSSESCSVLAALEEAYLSKCSNKSGRPEVAKVFQVEYHVVFVVIGSVTSHNFAMIHGEIAVPLFSMDKVNAKTVHEAIERGTVIKGFMELAMKFKMFVRACTTDGAAYNKKYKRAFSQLFPQTTKFEHDCDIHTWNNTLGFAMKVLDHDVSGSDSS